jgi:hypothetical protein
VKSSALHGGYRPRVQRLDDYGEKSLHKSAKLGNAVKLEHFISRAEGKEIDGIQKWIKKEEEKEQEILILTNNNKQTEPSPQRLNEKRTWTENEAGNDQRMEENNTEMPKSPPRQKIGSSRHS